MSVTGSTLELNEDTRSETVTPELIVPRMAGPYIELSRLCGGAVMRRRSTRSSVNSEGGNSLDFDLRSRAARTRFWALPTARQCAVAAVEHGNRHLEQIREVPADPEFPGR